MSDVMSTLSSLESSSRDFSRRNFFRVAAGVSALASMPLLSEFSLANAQRPHFADPNRGIHIDSNENPLGPSEAARKAMIDILPRGGRYLMNLEQEFAKTFAEQNNLDPESVTVYAGSTQCLHFAILANTSKERGLVLADPGYEPPMWAAQINGAPIYRIPLADPKGKATHDVKAMLAASATPGVIYICNPNNPTGTTTSPDDIAYVVNNAPKGTIVLIDEAYIHFSDAKTSLDYVRQGKDVIILRTFSKLYGMAGIRLGIAIGRPDLVKKLLPYGADNSLPITALVAGTASIKDANLIPERKKYIADVRKETIEWLTSKGYACTPSESNCFLVDVKKPGKLVIDALAKREMFIGRLWPSWPTHVRISVGTKEEMAKFRSDFEAVVINGTTASVGEMPARLWREEFPLSRLS